MKLKTIILSVFLAATLVFTPISAAQQMNKELPNFHFVDRQVARGAQPTPLGITILAKLGCKSILDLRKAGKEVTHEKQLAELLGMKFYSVPLSSFRAASKVDMNKIQSILVDDSNWPIFVHCKEGRDRTGTVIAIYRIINYRWPSYMALAEAEHYGLHWYHYGMKSMIIDWGFKD